MKKIILIAAVLVAVTLMSAPGKRAAEVVGPYKAGEEIEAIAPTVRSAGPRVQLRYEEASDSADCHGAARLAMTEGAEVWRADVPLRAELQAVLLEACTENGIDPLLMLGLIETESGFNEDIVSASGDYGLCQLNRLYFDPAMTPEENLQAGVSLLGTHLRTYGNVIAALTAYNRGHDDGTRFYAAAVLEKAAKWGYEP